MLNKYRDKILELLGLREEVEITINISEEDMEKQHLKTYSKEFDASYAEAVDLRNRIHDKVRNKAFEKGWEDDVVESLTNILMAFEVQRRRQLKDAGLKV